MQINNTCDLNTLSTISVILIQPHIPENIGFIARSMKSMGFSSLLLIDPGFPFTKESPAYKTACGSHDILDTTQIFRNFEEAIAPFQHVIGFSRRSHDFERPHYELAPWVEQNHAHILAHKTALVFGPEDYGLSNQDKRFCKHIVMIPMKADTLSLNLSHAVTVVLYEISKSISKSPAGSLSQSKPSVTQGDVQRLMNQMISMLDSTNYFKEGRKGRQIEQIRNLILRMNLDVLEYNSVMGIVNALLSVKEEP